MKLYFVHDTGHHTEKQNVPVAFSAFSSFFIILSSMWLNLLARQLNSQNDDQQVRCLKTQSGLSVVSSKHLP